MRARHRRRIRTGSPNDTDDACKITSAVLSKGPTILCATERYALSNLTALSEFWIVFGPPTSMMWSTPTPPVSFLAVSPQLLSSL